VTEYRRNFFGFIELWAKTYAQVLNLSIQPLPISVPDFAFSMLWYTRNDGDPGHVWLREAIAQLSRDSLPPTT